MAICRIAGTENGPVGPNQPLRGSAAPREESSQRSLRLCANLIQNRYRLATSGRNPHPSAALAISAAFPHIGGHERSEEHTSELQSLMRISYAVFCLKKKKKK